MSSPRSQVELVLEAPDGIVTVDLVREYLTCTTHIEYSMPYESTPKVAGSEPNTLGEGLHRFKYVCHTNHLQKLQPAERMSSES